MDRRVELYYNKNGTVEIVSQDSPPPVFSFFITIFCFLCGVSHNLIVLSAILSDEKLRSSSFHQILALLSLFCLLDCLTNESIAVGLLFNNAISWCSLSAVLFPLFLLLHTASLTLFCVERTCTLYKLPLEREMWLLGEISVCILGLLFSLPLLAASEVHYFRSRNSCGTVQHNSWAPALFLLGILLCWTCLVVYLFTTVRAARKQQQQTTFSRISVSGYHSSSASAPSVYDVTRACSKLMVLYVVLLVPQTVSVAVTHFLQLALDPDPWLDPRLPQMRSVSTADLELLLTYLRYMYNVAVPVVVLSTDSAVRLQARRVFCCSTNAVSSDASPKPDQITIKPSSYKTPVLFATPQGIHLRLGYHVTSADDSIRLITRFCDLTDGPDYTFSNTEESSGEDWSTTGEQRNVRFSSKVEAISMTGTTSGLDSNPRCSDTRTVLNPVLVRGQAGGPVPVQSERTYSKF